jgi:hypothetical protein
LTAEYTAEIADGSGRPQVAKHIAEGLALASERAADGSLIAKGPEVTKRIAEGLTLTSNRVANGSLLANSPDRAEVTKRIAERLALASNRVAKGSLSAKGPGRAEIAAEHPRGIGRVIETGRITPALTKSIRRAGAVKRTAGRITAGRITASTLTITLTITITIIEVELARPPFVPLVWHAADVDGQWMTTSLGRFLGLENWELGWGSGPLPNLVLAPQCGGEIGHVALFIAERVRPHPVGPELTADGGTFGHLGHLAAAATNALGPDDFEQGLLFETSRLQGGTADVTRIGALGRTVFISDDERFGRVHAQITPIPDLVAGVSGLSTNSS